MNPCKRMTVHAMGMDSDGQLAYARNWNKGECTGEAGRCGCTHAEINLLEGMPNPTHVLLSHSPCINCAEALVDANVKSVIYMKKYRKTEGITHLIRNGVVIIQGVI